MSVVSISLLLDPAKPAYTIAGLRGIMATMSNDFSLGLPVLMTLFPRAIYQYLFIITPIQLLLINPLGFVLVEFGLVKRDNELRKAAAINQLNGRADTQEQASSTDDDAQSSVELASEVPPPAKVLILPIMIRVARNPVVFMTVFGLLGNFAMNSSPPKYLNQFLGVLGSAFTAGALINLGGSMAGKTNSMPESIGVVMPIVLAGKLKGMGGKALLAPIMIICAKTIVFPILITLFLSALDAGGPITVDGVEYNMTLFAFFLGKIVHSTLCGTAITWCRFSRHFPHIASCLHLGC